MKYIFGLIACFFLFVLSSCAKSEPVEEKPFFAWTDSYIAIPVNSEWTVSLTYFYQEGESSLSPKNISALEFADVSENVVISDFNLTELPPATVGTDKPDIVYRSSGIQITFSASKEGIYETDKMIIHCYDGGRYEFLIGKWLFDVGEREPAVE
ncbi:MAG: hypothetical protein JW780_03990 [Clostridiales bacterium]|nr:hypothetical protein [Clostridiales bacterium]